jgi:hypothetical protein
MQQTSKLQSPPLEERVGERRPSRREAATALACHRVCAPLPNPLPALRWQGEGEIPGGGVRLRPPEKGCFDLSVSICLATVKRMPIITPRLRDSSTRWVVFHPSGQGLVAVPECPQNRVRSALENICRLARAAAGCEPTGTKSANPPPIRTPHSALRIPHSALRNPHSAIRTPQSALRSPRPNT